MKFDVKARTQFLLLLRETGLQNKSAAAIGVTPETVQCHKKKDEEFADLYAEALGLYRDSLEAEAHRRGVTGIEDDVYYKGEIVGQKRLYSDRILELQLKRHIPEYRDRFSADVNLTGGVLIVPGRGMSAEEWEAANRKEPK